MKYYTTSTKCQLERLRKIRVMLSIYIYVACFIHKSIHVCKYACIHLHIHDNKTMASVVKEKHLKESHQNANNCLFRRVGHFFLLVKFYLMSRFWVTVIF